MTEHYFEILKRYNEVSSGQTSNDGRRNDKVRSRKVVVKYPFENIANVVCQDISQRKLQINIFDPYYS